MQDKLRALEKDRESQTSSLNAREASLKVQLEKTQSERNDFKDQLNRLQSDVSKTRCRPAGPDPQEWKKSVAAEAEAEILRAKLHQLEKDRGRGIEESLQLRERGYAKELEQKQQDWDAVQAELQDQLLRLKKESVQKSEKSSKRRLPM